jgi:competence ComEA-like helix-hairpin-helix protein
MVPNGTTTSGDIRRQDSQSLGFTVGTALSLVVALSLVMATRGRNADTIRLTGRVNPNTATAASLARLPGIGLTRALAIVGYRSRIREETGIEIVFQRSEDIQKIRGIGPKTAEEITPWLDFGGSSHNVGEPVRP